MEASQGILVLVVNDVIVQTAYWMKTKVNDGTKFRQTGKFPKNPLGATSNVVFTQGV